MEQKRTCKGTCKKFRVTKPAGAGRYESGQGRCQTCDVWLDYRGCHVKDGSPARMGSVGWFCNCCNFRVRRTPRNKKYKEKLRSAEPPVEIPKFQDIMLPILQICGNREHHPRRDLVDEIAGRFRLTDEARRRIHHKNETVLYNRVSWALFYLRKAGLAESHNGMVSITERGQGVLRQEPDRIDREFLMGIPEFAEFYNKSKTGDKKQAHVKQDARQQPHADSSKTGRLNRMHSGDIDDFLISRNYKNPQPYRSILTTYISFVNSTGSGIEKGQEYMSNFLNAKSPSYRRWAQSVTSKFLDFLGQSMSAPGSSKTDRLNKMIAESMRLIRAGPDGVRMEDLKTSLGVSQEEMSGLATRLKRIDGVALEQTHRSAEPFDFLFTYRDPGMAAEPRPDKPHTGEEAALDAKPGDDLVQEMLGEYDLAKKATDKRLQRELTMEFLSTGSVKSVIEHHPDIPKERIKRHIRTPGRLPKDLRARNEEGLHPDPQLSLHIALFAVNHHDWDGDEGSADAVLHTAESIARHIIAESRSEDQHEKLKVPTKRSVPRSDVAETVSGPIAVWIATATLHIEDGNGAVFTKDDIVDKVIEQNLCNAFYRTIQNIVSSYCAANTPATGAMTHRKTYRVDHGMYRLYRRGDPHHPSRKNGRIAPLRFELPGPYRDLRRWYDEEYCAGP